MAIRSDPRAPVAIYPGVLESLPEEVIPGGRYSARFARSPEDLTRIQRLRFEVFNLELQEGLDSSFLTGLDQDQFDAHCHHLMVEHRADGRRRRHLPPADERDGRGRDRALHGR